MAAVLLNGVAGTTTITGTGNYTGISAVTTPAAFASFANVTDTTLVICLVRDATQWEIGEYTKSGGATPVLTRTTVIKQINGTASAVNWTAGEKFICTSVDGPSLMLKTTDNEMAARINMNGYKLGLDTDDDSYFFASADDDLSVYVNAAQFYRWFFSGGIATSSLVHTDSGAAGGPKVALYRSSASPLAADLIGFQDFEGNNSAAAAFAYARVGASIVDPTASSEDGLAYIDIAIAGVMRRQLSASSSNLALNGSNLAQTLINRTSGTVTTDAGIIVNTDGSIYTITVNNTPLTLDRTTSSGTVNMLDFKVAAVSAGAITVNSGALVYNPFMGAHYSEWHSSVADPASWEEPGTIVCTAEGVLEGFGGRLPLVVPSSIAGDKRVYGVMQSRLAVDAEPDDKAAATNEPIDIIKSYLQVGGLGAGVIKVTGAVEAGDFLETSDVPGAARAQASPCKTSATVAKATQDSPDDGTVRLIPCTYEAG